MSEENRNNEWILDEVDDDQLTDLADLFKIFSDSTRVRILYALYQGELNVQEICDRLSMQQSAISHQLKILKMANLVKYRRDGKTMYYRLADDHVFTIFAQGLEHINE